MKSFVVAFCLLLSAVLYAQTPEKTVNSFFEALNSKNVAQIEDLMADDAKLHSLNISAELQLSSIDKEVFINSIKNIGPEVAIEERIFDIQSLENNHIATVWVPYEFYVNDVFSHKGVNVFTMVKIDKNWKITSISDTREKNRG